ncbi:MAG: hypothetical protein PHC62_08755 [Candidatus Izemoplasmatales bacterium]|nr:hypothetical protein [Candidatus Izemoplasmatales bacterium]
MNIRDTYNKLANQELNLKLFNSVVELRNECKATNNFEYLYLSTLLMIDIYINENLLDDALMIASKSFTDIDKVVFSKIYVSVLERLIYIFIQKKNYRRAFRYTNEKRPYLDSNNVEEINRWYLENSYIYAAMGEKNKALTNLLAILANNPDENLKSIILSNITKLYIDDGDMINAIKYLEDTMTLTNSLKDKAGQRYCDYLNAKILISEKKYKFAYKIFVDMFKNLKEINDEEIGFLNEFSELLLVMDQYSDVKSYSDKYQKSVESSNDQYLKKDFYKNYLRASIMILPGHKEEIRKLLDYIELVEKEIARSDEISTTTASEDDKFLEVNEKMEEIINQVENTINLVNFAMVKSGERESILEFSKSLEKIVPFGEALFVIFNRANFELLPDLYDKYSTVSTFNYKKERLYERELPYSDLNDTIVELLISGNKDVTIDFTDTNIPVKNPIAKTTYLDQKVKWLFATTLNYDGDLYACAVFTSSIYDILSPSALVNLKIATKLLESKLVNLFYQENLQSQKDILQVAMSELQEGMFYYEIKRQRMLLTAEFSKFLGNDKTVISRNDYIKKIISEDREKLQEVEEAIKLERAYTVEYYLSLMGNRVLVKEHGRPYISRDGILKFYVCTITKNGYEREESNSLNLDNRTKKKEDNFLEKLESFKDKDSEENKFTLIGVEILNLQKFFNIKEKLISEISLLIKNSVTDEVFFLDNSFFISIVPTIDQKTIEKITRTVAIKLDNLEIDSKKVDVRKSISYIKYPKNINNLRDIYEVLRNMLEINQEAFTEEYYLKYLNRKRIINCVKDDIEKDDIEILYSPMYMGNLKVGYEIKYNLKGLSPEEKVNNYLDDDILTLFEKKLFQMVSISKDNLVKFIFISVSTLDHLITEKYFEDSSNIINRPILMIYGKIVDSYKIISYLREKGYKIYLDYLTLKGLNIEEVFNLELEGVIIQTELFAEERIKFLEFSRSQKYQLITRLELNDYLNNVTLSQEIINLHDMENIEK